MVPEVSGDPGFKYRLADFAIVDDTVLNPGYSLRQNLSVIILLETNTYDINFLDFFDEPNINCNFLVNQCLSAQIRG
ncbi:MAG: hypothetical protein Kow0042_00480 [Calditrichia bacterium]